MTGWVIPMNPFDSRMLSKVRRLKDVRLLNGESASMLAQDARLGKL